MPSIPSVGRNIAEPQLREQTISREQFRGDQTVSNAISFASQATAQYALDEKKQFDLARLTEARNILDVRETQLASDEKDGWQNKLGQNAVLFKDDEGKDFMNHYSDRYQKSIQDVETQLQLTPDQKKIFSEYAQQKAVGFNQSLMQHQLRQGKEYKVSVFENSVKISATKAQGQFTNFGEMDKTIEQMTADIGALGQELGWSNVEKSQKISESVNGVHSNNVGVMLESGDFMTAEAYVKQYGSKMSELQKLSTENKIRKMKDDFLAAKEIEFTRLGMSEGSNPAFNSSDLNMIKATSKINASEFGSLKYTDPRLDSIAVVTARDLKMDWAIPIVTAIRVAGEKSNNNQKSSADAAGVYQFTPIAIEQVRRLTGKTIDPTNPEEASWGALKFIEWIAEKYDTKDPAIIASYYNGGGNHIPQLKAGGVSAIKNSENRNYVSRIKAFDFSEYANRPVAPNGVRLRNLADYTPENQAKILANEEKIKKQRQQAEDDRKDMIYQKASDLIYSGQASFEELKKSPEILRALDAKQMTALAAQDKAVKSGDSSSQLNEVYQNPSALRGMPQSQFNTMIANSSNTEQKELSKMYAKANGRDVEALEKAEQEAAKKNGSTSLVTNKLIYDVVINNQGSLGFAGTTSSAKKVTNSTTDSAFYIAMKNDIFERTLEYDQKYFNKNGKHLSEFQIQNIARSFMTAPRTQDGKKVLLYDPKVFSRKEVTDGQKTNILRLAQADGHKYTSADMLPDALFNKYFFRFYRGKRAS